MNVSPLLKVLRSLSIDEQHELADLADTTRGYLYQIACFNRSPRVSLAHALVQAVATMRERVGARVPKLTIEQLAAMSAHVPRRN